MSYFLKRHNVGSDKISGSNNGLNFEPNTIIYVVVFPTQVNNF